MPFIVKQQQLHWRHLIATQHQRKKLKTSILQITLAAPTMYERVLQALFVMALEPEFVAIFEGNSYGF